MTHLEVESLASDYLEGLLEPSPRAAVEAHLVDCANCREVVGDLRHALELCRAAGWGEEAAQKAAKKRAEDRMRMELEP